MCKPDGIAQYGEVIAKAGDKEIADA